MKKILILYFSGAGATQKTAQLMYAALLQSHGCLVSISSIEHADTFQLEDYEALIIGTPVYHTAPSCFITAFFQAIKPLKKPVPAFIFNTRALYSCNTNRILAKQLLSKNIFTAMERVYRSPASDGALIMPFLRRFFEFEKNFSQKAAADCLEFLRLLNNEQPPAKLPRFHINSIFNAPNKLAGQLTTFPIHLHGGQCLKCGLCIKNCPAHAIMQGNDGFPCVLPQKCENCYRCIHHCPGKALSLSKRKTPKKLLHYDKTGIDTEA